MGKASRESGKQGEKLVRDAVRLAWKCEASRTAQHCGAGDSADVRVSIPGIFVESKFVKGGIPQLAWLIKATSDAAGKSIPVVIAKTKRHEPMMLMMDVRDSIAFARSLVRHLDGANQ